MKPLSYNTFSNNLSINKEFTLFVIASLVFSFGVQKWPGFWFYFPLYVTTTAATWYFSGVIFKANSGITKFFSIDLKSLHKFGIYIILALFILTIPNLNVPTLLSSSFETRSHSSTAFAKIVATVMLAFYIRFFTKEKPPVFLAIIVFISMIGGSFGTSRGGILLASSLAFSPFIPNIRFLHIFFASILVFVLSAIVLLVRLDLEWTKLYDVIFVFIDNEIRTIQPKEVPPYSIDNWVYAALFFIPSAIRGSFYSTNFSVSENLFGSKLTDDDFFVSTLGDFGLGFVQFNTEPLDLIVNQFIFSFPAFLLYHCLRSSFPSFRSYFLLLLILIGARAGLESVIGFYWWGILFPLIIVSFFFIIIKNIFFKRAIV